MNIFYACSSVCMRMFFCIQLHYWRSIADFVDEFICTFEILVLVIEKKYMERVNWKHLFIFSYYRIHSRDCCTNKMELELSGNILLLLLGSIFLLCWHKCWIFNQVIWICQSTIVLHSLITQTRCWKMFQLQWTLNNKAVHPKTFLWQSMTLVF